MLRIASPDWQWYRRRSGVRDDSQTRTCSERRDGSRPIAAVAGPASSVWLFGLLDIESKAKAGISPTTAVMTFEECGNAIMELALRGLEGITREAYLAGWRKLAVPAIGHIAIRILTNGMADCAVHA